MGHNRQVARGAGCLWAEHIARSLTNSIALTLNESKSTQVRHKLICYRSTTVEQNMQIVYAVDMKFAHEADTFNHMTITSVSCLNILSFSSQHLPILYEGKYSPHRVSS